MAIWKLELHIFIGRCYFITRQRKWFPKKILFQVLGVGGEVTSEMQRVGQVYLTIQIPFDRKALINTAEHRKIFLIALALYKLLLIILKKGYKRLRFKAIWWINSGRCTFWNAFANILTCVATEKRNKKCEEVRQSNGIRLPYNSNASHWTLGNCFCRRIKTHAQQRTMTNTQCFRMMTKAKSCIQWYASRRWCRIHRHIGRWRTWCLRIRQRFIRNIRNRRFLVRSVNVGGRRKLMDGRTTLMRNMVRWWWCTKGIRTICQKTCSMIMGRGIARCSV